MDKKTPFPPGFFSDPTFRRKVQVVLDGYSSDPAKVSRAQIAAARLLARKGGSVVVRPEEVGSAGLRPVKGELAKGRVCEAVTLVQPSSSKNPKGLRVRGGAPVAKSGRAKGCSGMALA